MTFLIFFLIISNSIFISLAHPLSMGLMLMTQTLFIALFSSIFMNSFWYSYILILVFLGGMLILFIYVASIASNEMFNFRNKSTLLSAIMVSLLFLMFPPFLSKIYTSNDSWFFDTPFLWQFSNPLIPLSSFLVMYLFFVLVAIVKITKFWNGTLRMTS